MLHLFKKQSPEGVFLEKSLCIFQPPVVCLASRPWLWSLNTVPGSGPKFVFTSPGHQFVFTGSGPVNSNSSSGSSNISNSSNFFGLDNTNISMPILVN